jgi:hypothetical protein
MWAVSKSAQKVAWDAFSGTAAEPSDTNEIREQSSGARPSETEGGFRYQQIGGCQPVRLDLNDIYLE